MIIYALQRDIISRITGNSILSNHSILGGSKGDAFSSDTQKYVRPERITKETLWETA